MTTTVIPAKTVVNCDRCGVECNETNRKRTGHLSFYRGTVDAGGVRKADSQHWDFCDACLNVIDKALKAATAQPKKEPAP